MTILPILKYPDPRLKMVSEPVTVFDESLRALAEDMRHTMIAAPGAGLAAPQVDRRLRMVVIDWTGEGERYGDNVLTLVNPVITAEEGDLLFEEGCLSVEELTAEVLRAARVEVRAQDELGRPVAAAAEGRRAVAIQHELDHLDGILFIDHISRLKRETYNKSLLKSLKARGRP
jgi:peptide deformylase